jgi:ATP-dependent Clp endopeptidase proteolytic subunit ClpP
MPRQKSAPKSVNEKWYSIRAAGDGQAEVLIYGDIGDSWFSESVTAKKFVEDLQGLADKDIVVRINSYGGSVADGVAIHNAIRRHPKAKSTAIDGVAISIASLIALAGDDIEMAENAILMIHDPWGQAQGNSTHMRRYADVLDKFAEAMSESYARHTGMPKDQALELVTSDDEFWYTADEALKAGLIDKITEDAPAEEAARYRAAVISRFHVPAAVAAAFNPQGDHPMPLKTPKQPATTDVVEDDDTLTPEQKAENAKVSQIREAAAKKERERLAARNVEIRAVSKPFMEREGIAELVNKLIDNPEITTEKARQEILAELGKGTGPLNQIRPGAEDERDKRVLGMGQALQMRLGAEKPDAGNPWRGHRLHEMARECLRAAGVRVDGLSQLEIASLVLTRDKPRGAQTTSDFPVILENTMHKLVLTGFMAQTSTWARFTKVGSVSDFRAWNRIVPGLIGNLDTVNEHGEYKNKAIPDGQKNPITATRKGNIINVTPEVLVNDDTGYIQTMAQSLGGAGQRAIERAVYALLLANPTLSDGVALFHATHANLAGSGAVPTVDLLDAAKVAMSKQTAPGADAEYLSIVPAIAVVTGAQEGNMKVLVNAVYDPDTANKLQKPNKVNGIVRDVVSSPWLTGTTWTLFADPNVAPVIEVVFLDGQQTPKVTEEVNFRTSGLAWKVELPFGVGAVDYRGAYRNPGA